MLTQSYKSLNYQDQENNWLQTINTNQDTADESKWGQTDDNTNQHTFHPASGDPPTTITPPAGVEEL